MLSDMIADDKMTVDVLSEIASAAARGHCLSDCGPGMSPGYRREIFDRLEMAGAIVCLEGKWRLPSFGGTLLRESGSN